MDPSEFDPESTEGREVAGAVAEDPSDFLSLMGHFYRGEIGRTTAWRARLDRTTNWAVVLTATLLTWAFSAADRPHYVVLVGVVMVLVFLVVEARRYRTYDVWRSRVRLLEENVFANALDPEGVEHREWRELLSDDLRDPAVKTPYVEAVGRRLRRIYLPLLTVLVLAWGVHLALFGETTGGPVAAARIAGMPGVAVVAVVAAVFLTAVGLAAWPVERRAKGELQEDETVATDWKDDSDE